MKKDCIALLTISEVPKLKKEKARLVKWLLSCAKEIEKEDSKVFNSPCRFRLLK